ncbi:zinc finger, C3HC4 type (RING finger) protein (macronuclear) [Tetrahymena thermophila SB210]|uniref:RING-type E3 ubiquitin transferase n=1 Tax=Tetrahymena thermophila (strain SB210) TaxID=312017 RepID=W7XAP9_TETTS|nr:zinc finger, C3HC4 type (RING finger) protein [Tetrahymena thermophila SB210]EWS73493.1 zinc finger, C3HC4 type (RING finger) protein [Tetrahymena thermophila SB210]|eukprot:XP_012653975.1 zinc finger, C3HC4 type (RING finger) protein [Tetrahymena thermophila SB210]
MDYLYQNEKIKKQRTEQYIHLFFLVACIAIWIYYYKIYSFTVILLNSQFLPYFTIGQFSFGCLVLFLYLFTRNKPRFIKLYSFLSVISLILILLGILVIFGLWIMHPDIFQEENHPTNYLLCTTELVQLFTYFLVQTTHKTLKLMIQIEFFEQYIHLLLQHNLVLEGETNLQAERKNIRVNSVSHSQMNMIFGNQCTICNEDTDIEQKAVQLECMHVFHSECIRKWLENSQICPNCRREVEGQ